jgi:hypothetical protein
MPTLNAAIKDIEMPWRIKDLPIDERGFPVPHFVEWIDGKPDFRVMSKRAMVACVKHHLCWICGQPLGRHLAFALGPMCAINRVNSEPPSHLECARYAARACPFLARPHAKRREVGLPEGTGAQAGIPIDRNPGAVGIWTTRSYRIIRVDNGDLFELGNPVTVEWWAQGRPATRAEVWQSIESGLPILRDMALQEGPKAIDELHQRIAQAMPLLPPEPDLTETNA